MINMKKISKLGLYDSGLGGYSIYDYLKNSYPNLNLVLYADQKNAPYGNKDKDVIVEYARDAMKWFIKQKITHVLIACNTVSAVALDIIKQEFQELSIYGIIDLTIQQVNEKKVGVMSTLATYKSQAYRIALEGRGHEVSDKATVELVEYIETMRDTNEYLKKELKDFEESESLILACTHYPLVIDTIKKYYNGIVHDSREPIATFLKDLIIDSEFNDYRVVTTGDALHMKQQIKKLFNIEENVEGVK